MPVTPNNMDNKKLSEQQLQVGREQIEQTRLQTNLLNGLNDKFKDVKDAVKNTLSVQKNQNQLNKNIVDGLKTIDKSVSQQKVDSKSDGTMITALKNIHNVIKSTTKIDAEQQRRLELKQEQRFQRDQQLAEKQKEGILSLTDKIGAMVGAIDRSPKEREDTEQKIIKDQEDKIDKSPFWQTLLSAGMIMGVVSGFLTGNWTGAARMVFGTVGRAVLRKIPVISVLFGLYGGSKKIQQGDILGGALEIAAGFAYTIPGLGIPLGMAIDVISAARDVTGMGEDQMVTPEGAAAGEGILKGAVRGAGLLFARKIPVISLLLGLATGIPKFKAGDYIGGALDIAAGIAYSFPGLGPVIGIGIDLLNVLQTYVRARIDEPEEERALRTPGEGILRKLPFIGPVMNTIDAIMFARDGRWGDALKSAGHGLMAAVPGSYLVFSGIKWFYDKFTTDKIDADGETVPAEPGDGVLRKLPVIGPFMNIIDGIRFWRAGNKGDALKSFGYGLISVVPGVSAVFSGIKWVYDTFARERVDQIRENVIATKDMTKEEIYQQPIIGFLARMRDATKAMKAGDGKKAFELLSPILPGFLHGPLRIATALGGGYGKITGKVTGAIGSIFGKGGDREEGDPDERIPISSPKPITGGGTEFFRTNIEEYKTHPDSSLSNFQDSKYDLTQAPGPFASNVVPNSPNLDVSGIEPDAWHNFMGMAEEYAEKTGNSIYMNSAYRSLEDQKRLYQRYGAGRAAKPGRSMHGYGVAFDINSAQANELSSMGLMDKWNFHRPIKEAEPWHIEVAGINRNAIREAGISGVEERGIGDGPGDPYEPPELEQPGRNIPIKIQGLFDETVLNVRLDDETINKLLEGQRSIAEDNKQEFEQADVSVNVNGRA